MTKRMRMLLCVLLAAALALSLAPAALAEEASVVYEGHVKGFSFAPGSVHSASDLFPNFKNLMPGDVRTQDVFVESLAKDCDYVVLSLRAVVNETAPEVSQNAREFLSQLTVRIYHGTKLISESTPQQPNLEGNYPLGAFFYGQKDRLTVELSVPIELGNEFADLLAAVDWTFHAESFNLDQCTVTKVWEDSNAKHAGDSVTVNLLCDGAVSRSCSLSSANAWTYTFDQLPAGHVWTAEETGVPEGYEAQYATRGNVTVITNRPKDDPPAPGDDAPAEEPLALTVRKLWAEGTKNAPASVNVTLYHDGTEVETVALSAANGWTHTWTELSAEGTWQALETSIPKGFTPTYSVDPDGTVVITNAKTLLQTGQRLWPIALLVCLGAALMAGGAVLLRRKRS